MDTAAQLTGQKTASGYKGVFQPAPLRVLDDLVRNREVKVRLPIGSVGYNASKGMVHILNQEYNIYEAVKDMDEK